MVGAHYEKDETIKAKKLAEVKSETIPFYLGKFEGFAKENNGHLALGKVFFLQRPIYLFVINHNNVIVNMG